MDFTLLYSAFLVITSIARFIRIRKTRGLSRKKGKVRQKYLFKLMVVFYLLIMLVTVAEYFVVERTINYFVTLLGVVMYVGVIPVRSWAINSLAEFMSEDIEIRPEHRLRKEGPYRYVRHPLLACLSLEVIGFTLIPNAYYSLAVVFIIYLPLVLFRKNLEEKALIEKFGEEYLAYKKQVRAFLPMNIACSRNFD